MCLAGATVESWSLTGSNPFTVMTNIFVTEFNEVNENIEGKLKWMGKLYTKVCTAYCPE